MNRSCLLAIAIVVVFWIAFALFVVSAIAAPRSAPVPSFPVADQGLYGAPQSVVSQRNVGDILGVMPEPHRTSLPYGAPLPSVASWQPTNAPANVSVTGTATWYRAPSIRDAAAGPALRVGHWRGSTVTVCASECVTVRLTDWCACPHHLIDLDSRAFRRLAPLSAGVVHVTVLVGGLPIAPATDR